MQMRNFGIKFSSFELRSIAIDNTYNGQEFEFPHCAMQCNLLIWSWNDISGIHLYHRYRIGNLNIDFLTISAGGKVQTNKTRIMIRSIVLHG